MSCLHSPRQGPSPPPCRSPVLRCGSPRATGPTPWCWSNPSTRRAGRTSRWPNKTKVDFAGGRLSVKTTVAGDKNGSVAITIDLPTGSSLVAYLAHSGVHADGSFGECELHMASGRVQLDRIDALQANIAAGEVAIGHIAGRADIDGAAFALRIGEVEGTVGLSSSGGRAWIGHASADLELSSGSGGFDIDRADGSVTATTASGAIRIGRMRSRSGEADERLGQHRGRHQRGHRRLHRRQQRARVGAQLRSGTENPDASDAKVSVHARTRHGDIIIQRAAS